MRRILLFTTDLLRGGTPTVVRELAIRLKQSAGGNCHVEVACLATRGVVAEEIEAAGIVVTSLGAKRPTHLHILPKLARLIRNRELDTVLSFLIHANAAAAAVRPFCPGVRFIQAIQTTQPDPKWHWKLQKLIGRAADRIVVPSPSVAQAAADWSGIPASKIVVIPNAIDPADYAGITPPADLELRRPFPVGFIGRLDPIKRIGDLLEATAQLKGLVHTHIFGDGPEMPSLKKRIEKLGISENATLHGVIARPQEALRQIGILVLPSAAEGFGLVLIEAMAAGVPVVATNVAGIRDVVENGRTGMLVPAADPAALAVAIAGLVNDSALRKGLVQAGMAHVRDKFSWETVLPAYRRLLNIDP